MRLRMDHTKDLAPLSTLEEVLESIRALDKNILSQETSSIGRFPQPMRARTLLGSALDALTMPVDSTVTLSKRNPTTTQTIRENPKSFTEQLLCQSYDASQVAAFNVLGKTERASEARNTVKSKIENRVDPVSENAIRSSQLSLPVHKYGHSVPGPCASNRKLTSSGSMVAPKKWKDDSAPEMKKNSRVWYSTAEDKWILGTILSVEDGGVTVRIRTADGHVLETSTAKLQPSNPDLLEGVDDLIQLTYLNQPAILHNIAYRYQKDIFYVRVEAVSLEKIVVIKQGLATRYCKTRAGPVLIAVNPFKRVPIYSLDFIQAYRKRSGESLHPHVYMTTDNAFEAMVRDDVNQSIIISGESGAGKTETAKITMQYLAALGGGGGLEDEILQTNPILEAFGNAKTLRNDNSSRFGKLIDIHFDGTRKICRAKIQTYLLEKSRVVQQAMDERSYHIFYQLCAGADHALRERIYLKPAKDFRYLIQSSCLTINHVDDAEQFHVMTRAMDVVQISKEDQEAAFEMISAVLWLGNITFSVREQDNHVTVDDNEAVNVAASLLHCKVGELIRALSTHKIRAGTEDIVQRLTYSQAVDSRDALAKAIYANLFDWLVDRINKSLKVGKWRTGRCISILDIYGFESFKKNSFEQLCINYANERLQQHFNRHLFKLEQEEYTNERIDWTRVDFEDNKECLDLIEKRPLGLISLLDEECTFPRATDVTLAEKLIEHLKSNSCFKGERSKAFRICHYAGQVVYDTSGFLEKNRDVLHADLLQLLASCDSSLPRLFAESIGEIVQCNPMLTPRSGGPETHKQSVATKFKRDDRPPKSQLDTSPLEHPYVYGIWQGQLNKLMQRLENTAPHFIRCIKPNTLQLPHIFEQELVLQQLRCCGVLEVVRISRSGYPSRHLHQQFADRYEFLLPQSLNSQQDMLSLCVTILRHFGISPEMYQIGLTKLFFRVGQIGILEDVRQQTLHGIISVQKVYKGYAIRNQYKQLRKVAILLQSMARGAQARRHYKKLLLRHEAAVIIQKNVRKDAACHNYYVTRNTIIKLQAVVRGWLLRRRLQEAGTDFAATEAGVLEEDPDGYFVQVSAEDEASSVEVDDELLLELPGISSSSSSPTHTSRPSEMGLLELNEDPGTGVQPQYLLELQQRATMAEKALLQKEEENVILRHRLQHHESLWPEYEDKVLALEIMWQKQMRSLQQTLSSFKKCLSTDEPGRIITHKLEASNCNVVPRRRASRHLLIREDDDFDWDDDTTVGAKSPENSFTPRDYTPSVDQEFATCRGELDAGQSAVVGHLIQEFEHRTQVFNDDADFLVEVKSGLTEASLNPDEELRKLKGRFDTWKKDFKLRLRETRVVLQKLGNLENAEKTKRNWWGRRTHP